MSDRTRSPSYPSTPINQAIDYARKIHQTERTHTVDREVAAKAMGYAGISGRSATILSDLSQYGLLERAGKSEVRITSLAVELLHPDDQFSWEATLLQAAKKPDLFQRVAERFPEGMPSEAALVNFLVKQGFTNAAIPSAVNAYRETFSYLENAIERRSSSQSEEMVAESPVDQRLTDHAAMNRQMLTAPARADLPPATSKTPVVSTATGPDVRLVNRQIHIAGVLDNQADVDDVIETLTFLRAKVKPAPVEQAEAEELPAAN